MSPTMKHVYALLLFFIVLNANANSLICSQLENNTHLPFHYEVGKQGFHLNTGNTSPIIGFDNSYEYRLLDGTITAYAGGVQITENGHFSILAENIKVSSRHHCKVAYLVRIYD